MALRTSWLARPPTAAANGGRVPLAVLDSHRTNSVFTEAWNERGREERKRKGDFKAPVCMQSGSREWKHKGGKKEKEKEKQHYSLYSWELRSLLQLASVKPQHPVNTWRHQSKTAHDWMCHTSTTSHTENHSQGILYFSSTEGVQDSRLNSREIFCLPNVGKSTVLLLEGVQSQHGSMDL